MTNERPITMSASASQLDALQVPSKATSSYHATSPKRSVSPAPSNQTGIVVFSGGSAANNLVEVFEHVREANRCNLSYVIPISDNGGSTSEIIRVFGGPGNKDFL